MKARRRRDGSPGADGNNGGRGEDAPATVTSARRNTE
jgi:hypothetical protein